MRIALYEAPKSRRLLSGVWAMGMAPLLAQEMVHEHVHKAERTLLAA